MLFRRTCKLVEFENASKALEKAKPKNLDTVSEIHLWVFPHSMTHQMKTKRKVCGIIRIFQSVVAFLQVVQNKSSNVVKTSNLYWP